MRSQLESTSKVRHIILVTDGQSPGGFEGLVQQMRDNDITLSVVGVG